MLVIPTSCGARGLNLTVANHVIFVEPQLDATQLAQVNAFSISFIRTYLISPIVVSYKCLDFCCYRLLDALTALVKPER